MSEFWKRPKFWIGFVLILWLAYIMYQNFQLAPVELRLIPFFATLQLRVSAIIIGSAISGCILTLGLQFLWRRAGSSKNAAQSAAPSDPSSSTTA
jgi:uncharacterized integral membrane protein